jgi:hypothetical protein
MKVIAKVTMFKTEGSACEKEIFTKGKEYEYFVESSTWQNKLVKPNDGTGQYLIFNEENFIKYFSLK